MLTVNILNVSIGEQSFGPEITAIALLGSEGKGEIAPRGQLVIPWHDLQANPSLFSFLSWHTALSKFVGRDRELALLNKWARSEPALSVKFITGEGGIGKSRLAGELAKSLSLSGWTAGFVDIRKSISIPLTQDGNLLIVDYPEENLAEVKELLRDLSALGRGIRIRTLFLTRRPVEFWMPHIIDAGATTLLDTDLITLDSLPSAAAHSIFSDVQERTAESLSTIPVPVSEDDLAQWLERAPEHHDHCLS
jgi:hypothetical protein